MKQASPFRQRFPFLPLVLLAVTGILAAEFIPWSSALWVALALIAAVLFYLRRLLFPLAIIAIFAAVHLWQSRESPAARLALLVPDHGILAEVEGVAVSEPRALSEKLTSFELRLSQFQGRPAPPIRILVTWPGPGPSYGDEIRAIGPITPIPPPRNPGQFNFALWSERRGIFSHLTISHPHDTTILAHGPGNPLVSLALRIRERMKQILTSGISDPVIANLLVGMVLGDVSELPGSVLEEFRGTGTFHLFSVSGLHVGILASILWFVFRSARLARRYAAILTIPILFFYALMSGLGPASVRSAMMAAIILGGFLLQRKPILLNNLFAAAFLILLWDTNQLFNVGFQLSFSVVATIFLLEPVLNRRMAAWLLPDPFFPRKLLSPLQRRAVKWGEKFTALVAVSIAAWIGSLPLTLFYFHLISFTALPANLVAVPLSFAIMIVSVLSLALGSLSASAAAVVNQLNLGLCHLMLGAVHFFASIPGAFVFVATPALPKPQAEIVIFDFGSGGAAWINARGRAWLLDTGPQRRHDTVLLPFLRSQGRQTLDGLILTHGDSTHIGAARDLLTTCPPQLIVESTLNDRSSIRNQFHAELVSRHLPKSLHRSGDRLAIAPGVTAHILYPPPGIASRVADDKTLVLRLDIAGIRILFLSDAGLAVEEWLLAHASRELPSHILVKGSPRHSPSGGKAFLDAVSPQLLIATAASFPNSEKISPELIRELTIRNITLFRQDETGAVTLRLFPKNFQASGFVNHQQYTRAQ